MSSKSWSRRRTQCVRLVCNQHRHDQQYSQVPSCSSTHCSAMAAPKLARGTNSRAVHCSVFRHEASKPGIRTSTKNCKQQHMVSPCFFSRGHDRCMSSALISGLFQTYEIWKRSKRTHTEQMHTPIKVWASKTSATLCLMPRTSACVSHRILGGLCGRWQPPF